MSGLIERLQRKMKQIHSGESYHSLSTMRTVIDETLSTCDEALKLHAWQPYAAFAQSLHNLLQHTQDCFPKSENPLLVKYPVNPGLLFNFLVNPEKETRTYLQNTTERARGYVKLFEKIYCEANNEVIADFWPLEGPAETGRDVSALLATGRFMIVRSEGAHLVDFEFKPDEDGKVYELAEIITPHPLTYREALIRPHTKGAFIEAHAPDKYPLEETIIPVLMHQYAEDVLKLD